MTPPPIPPFVAQTAGQARLLLHSAYGPALETLMRGEASAGEVARMTAIPVKQAHHRLTRLLEAGLITVTGERQRGGRPIKLYRASSTVYQVPFALTDAATEAELVTGMTQPYLMASMEAIGHLFMTETNQDVLVALDSQQHLSITLVGTQDKRTSGPRGLFGTFTQVRLGRESRGEAERRMRELRDWLAAQEALEMELPDAQTCIAGLFWGDLRLGTKTCANAAALGDQREIGLVQEEIAGQLFRRGVSSKLPVTGGLVIGKEFNGH